ncbi:MAG: C4-type zinc ribbon domain-containing protein [Candidatus Jettenia sp.]|nr:MAG: C4-type zinc ribbon domain-containing protein [Candidatus Jettenia sp.]
MNKRIMVLQNLQSIDTKLKRLEGDKLYRSYDVQKKQNQIQQKREKLLKTGEEVKASQKDINIKELDLRSIEADINKLRIQMNQVKTNKEYSAIKTEIGGKEADKSVLEDEILRMMEKYEEMQGRYKSSEKEIQHEELELKDLQKRVENDLQLIEDEITKLEKKRSEYTALADSEALQHYSRLVGHKDAVAIVNVVNKVCQGCFMSITSQTLNQLLSDKDLTFCHSCGRILYLDNNNEE